MTTVVAAEQHGTGTVQQKRGLLLIYYYYDNYYHHHHTYHRVYNNVFIQGSIKMMKRIYSGCIIGKY